MKYRIFDTEQEALQAEEQISANMGFVRIGLNAKTGEPEPDKQATVRWAVPKQTSGGQWVFASPDEEGVEFQPDWWPQIEDGGEPDETGTSGASTFA